MENLSVYETPSKETPKIVEDPSVLSPADMQRFRSRLQFYQNAFAELYENMVENTDLIGKVGDDLIGGLNFLGLTNIETGREIYEKSFYELRLNAQKYWEQILTQTQNLRLSPEQVRQFHILQAGFETLLRQRFQSPNILQASLNTDYDAYAESAGHGAKGLADGAWHGVKESVKFIGESLGVLLAVTLDSTARNQFLQDIETLLSQLTLENAKRAYEVILQKLKDIGNLPADQQSQAIGKIGGEISVIFLGTGAVAKIGRNVMREGTELTAAGLRTLSEGKIVTGVGQVALGGMQTTGGAGTIVMAEGVGMTGKAEKGVGNMKRLFESMSVEDIARLSDVDRLQAGSVFLGRELTQGEQKAILSAHNIGMGREGADVYNYTFGELKAKLQILEEAGFSQGERKLLLEKGVCGRVEDAGIGVFDLVYASKSFEEFLNKLPTLNLHELKMITDSLLGDLFKLNAHEILEKYGISPERLSGLFETILIQKERLLYHEVLKVFPDCEIVDIEKGIYAITSNNGEKLYGSIYSIIDAHPELGHLGYLASKVQVGHIRGDHSLMGIRVSAGYGYKSVITASGSFAQNRINKFPGDLDFAEHFIITAKNLESGKQQFTSILRENILKTSQDSRFEFVELKFGHHPFLKGTDGAPISLKWSLEELEMGGKSLIHPETGEGIFLKLEDALQTSGIIKIDYICYLEGSFKEVTNVINLTINDINHRSLYSNKLLFSSFQEVYFANPELYGITELIRKSDVYGKYIEFLKGDIVKYAHGSSPNYLKAAKRLYNYLKINGDLHEAEKLAELFHSPASELAMRLNELDMISMYLSRGGTGKFKLSEFIAQNNHLVVFLKENIHQLGIDDRLIAEVQIISHELSVVPINKERIQMHISMIEKGLYAIVNMEAYKYLDNNIIFKNLIHDI